MLIRVLTASALVALVVACHRGSSNAEIPTAAPPADQSMATAQAGPPVDTAARARAQAAYDQGYARAVAGDFEAALTLFRDATESDPTIAVAWFDLAGLSEQLGDKPAARAAMERCVEVEPAFIQARVELATLYIDDPDAAMYQLRQALTEPKPFVVDRYPASHSRGEGLHKLAVIYALRGFPAATASIERSLIADPTADIDSRAERIARHAEDDVAAENTGDPRWASALVTLQRAADSISTREAAVEARSRQEALISGMTGSSGIDQWRLWQQISRLEVTAQRPDAARSSLEHAAKAASRLPLEHWLDTAVALIALEVRAGRISEAARTFDELAWLEYVTAHAAPPVGGRSRTRIIATAAEFAPLRAHADYKRVVLTLAAP